MQNNQPWFAVANIVANLFIGLGCIYLYSLA
jgi:hypothetical protein